MSNNTQEKILAEIVTAAGRYILEGGPVPKFLGDKKQAQIISNATLASRRLYEALCDKNVSLEAVTIMIEEKKSAALQFEKCFGRLWRF
jgi:hypothetical protein